MRILLVLTFLCATLAAQNNSPRPEDANRQWEYASVSGQPLPGNTATICYAIVSGCKREVIRVNDEGAVNIGDVAIMKATFKLAQEGWELVSTDSHPQAGRTLMFRRPKSKSMQ